jgi:hypothetical protein
MYVWINFAETKEKKNEKKGRRFANLQPNGEHPVRRERSNAMDRGAKETVEYSARGTPLHCTD